MEAGLLDEARLVRPVMCHEEHRWRIEALDEAPGLFVDAERERPADALHAARAEPLSGCLEQRLRHLFIVDGVRTEEPDVVLVEVEVKAVDLCRAARRTSRSDAREYLLASWKNGFFLLSWS